MSFWTIDEFRQFVDCIMDKRQSYMCFMILYWTGMRLGELLALTSADIDLDKHTISITQSYQRLEKKDVVTPPKTPKSKRLITIPEFLVADIKDYMDSLYEVQEDDRLFPVTKYFLEHEIYNFERCHSALNNQTPASCYYPTLSLDDHVA